MKTSMQPNPEDNFAADEERRLQELFRDNAADYIADAGFSAQVVGRLPVPRRRRRTLLLGAALLLGSAVAGLLGGQELVVTLADGCRLFMDWSVRPLPGAASLLTIGSAALLLVSLGIAWWSCARAA